MFLCAVCVAIARTQGDVVVKEQPQPQAGDFAVAPFEARWARQALPRDEAAGASASSTSPVPPASAAHWLTPPAAGDEVQV